jgi:hypothetical protein
MLGNNHQKTINKGIRLYLFMRHLLQSNILPDDRDRIGHMEIEELDEQKSLSG